VRLPWPGWAKGFYESQRADISLHRAAKKHFNSLGLKKLPTMDSLKREYATLAVERKKLYGGFKQAREEMIRWKMTKQNADMILAGPRRSRVYERDEQRR